MRILVADDERLALDSLCRVISEIVPGAELAAFTRAREALEYARSNRVDVAFLDIEMPALNGMELASALKDAQGRSNIIFVTGYPEYALDAFGLHASGYLLKPAAPEKVRRELENLRLPIAPPRPEKRLQVQCFGNFEVFAGGKPVVFARSKAKELLAYLINKRGTACTTKELAAILFEDKEYGQSQLNYLQTIIASLIHTLSIHNAKDAIIKKYNAISLDVSRIDCDFYRFLEWDMEAVNKYTGEFMAQYAWAEFTIGYLDRKMG